MRNTTITSFLALAAVLNPLASLAARTWNDENNPANIGQYNYQFDRLPKAGAEKNEKRGWADTYWPLEKGMIANRWQVPGSNFKKDKSPTNVSYLSQAEISLLSPAEKFDLARGDYGFTLAKKIRKDQTGNEREWRGLCNGWTHASLNFDEPNPTIFTNKDGLKIPFGASDIKGLLAYYYAKVDESSANMVGSRCRLKPRMSWASDNCADINAGAFHVVMANELGIKKQGFAADQDPYNEVWNQPYTKFESKVVSEVSKYKGQKLSKHASKDAVREITISSDVYFADDEDVTQSVEPYIATGRNKVTKVNYNYVIEVNAYGNIIGGEWLDDVHPDFIWKQTFAKPTGDFRIVEKIYEQSQQ